ncbi:mechanosensitive ion channel family protein [Myroides marinus]|uniref:mechanosensitive ion channel family protein n=1 Tax=Myroides marinus TaxID=703342 RepID=UPI0025786DFF|nr:mechanosensitive ion channel family protein [Myroides marinus]MDM1362417.1 mechanosensitive ion channel family protein [Myroides marinus]MDM1370103.1 mechanosensitive ion channel family protein [Myroides marinus]MDM1376976.1 mechanosensitive ion channel family protein [Myroides marinus]MDM1384341.1 mechanosensitive ion channel family protein [Myroides marinus]MDM1405351.1 mechanosensitive ion channel family protein [Myroides marinus]
MRFNIFNIRFFIVLTAVLMAGVVFGKKKNNTKEQIDTVQTSFVRMERTPVLSFNDTLFNVYGNIGSFTSKQRAKSIESKISMLADNYLFQGDSIKLSDEGTYLNIVYKNEILMSVDSLQAAQENKTRVEAAEHYRAQIISAVETQLHNTSWQQILMQVAGAVAILIVEFFILKWIRYGYRVSRVMIWRQRGKKIKGIFGIIDEQRAMLTTMSIAKIIKLLIVLIVLYMGLLAVFKLFPYTKHLSDQLLEYVLSPLRSVGRSIMAYMPKLFTIVVIVVIFRYIQKFVRSLADKIATHKIVIRGFYPDWAIPTYNLVSGLLFIFMFILIFPYLPNSDSQIFQGVSVFAGIMLSLGSTSVIGNLVAGLVITYMRPFKLGDRIKLGEFTGDVLEKTALVTRIKTPKNEVITIPNSNIMTAQTVNYSQSAREHGLILYLTIGAGYHVPWQKVHEMLYEVASRTEHVMKRQKPFIFQDQFQDFYVEYQLNVYIRDAKLSSKVYSDLRQHAQDVFAENDIEMVAPHFHFNRIVDGDDSTVPPKYVKDQPEKK